MGSLQIKDVAERTGFSAATLRYYEEIGLLPAPPRTAAGYRTYDDATIERLAFISRAKQLGCTLDEIADLTAAWDGGRCGPVQDRLRELVAQKLDVAQTQIVELATLSRELRSARAVLELHRPDGPCDDRCGCVGEVDVVAPVLQSANPTCEVPIACTLDAGGLADRLAEWAAVLTRVVRRVALDGGMRLELRADASSAELLALVSAEQTCCPFFRFAITVDERGLALEVRGPDDAQPVIAALFGSAS